MDKYHTDEAAEPDENRQDKDRNEGEKDKGSQREDASFLEESELSHRAITGERIEVRATEEEFDEKCNLFFHDVSHPAAGFYMFVAARRLQLKGFIQFCSCEKCSQSIGFELFLQAPKKIIETYLKLLLTPSSIDNLINFNDLQPVIFWRGDDNYRDKGDFTSNFIFRFPPELTKFEQIQLLNTWGAMLVEMDCLTNIRNTKKHTGECFKKLGELRNVDSRIEGELRDTHKSLRELLSEIRRTKAEIREEDKKEAGRKEQKGRRETPLKGILRKDNRSRDGGFDPSFG